MLHNINPEIEHLAAPIGQFTHYDGNARTHDLQLIAASLKANTQYRPLVVRRHEDPSRDNVVLAGNGTLAAARDLLGWDVIAAEYVQCDDRTARRIVLIDNRANDVAGYNDSALAALLKDLEGDYEGTGFKQEDLDSLLDSLKPPEVVKPELEFADVIGEVHNYVVLTFENEIDWRAAMDTFGVTVVKAWDSREGYSRSGLGRVIDGVPVLRRLNGGD